MSPMTGTPAIPVTCPECGSRDLDRLREPETGLPVEGLQEPIAACRNCGHVFSVPRSALDALPVLLPRGSRIDVETVCRQRGYILKTLRVGSPCPECGTTIDDCLPPPGGAPRRTMRASLRIAWSLLVAALISAAVPVGLQHRSVRAFVVCPLWIAALVLAGVSTISKRSFRGVFHVGLSSDTGWIEGRAAVVLGYVLLAMALCVLAATIGVWTGLV